MQSKLKRILVYISDHHYGHATRMVALARALFKTGKYEIIDSKIMNESMPISLNYFGKDEIMR